MPPNTVKVDRSTRWGNPYRAGMLGVPDAAAAVARFRRLLERPDLELDHTRFFLTPERIRADLTGRNLACWCAIGDLCHADVLLEMANR